MNPDQNNKAWSALTPTQRTLCRNMYKSCGDSNVEYILEELFSKENLTSDTEPEELLTAKRSEILWRYKEAVSTSSDNTLYPELRGYGTGVMTVLRLLFDNKCIPDGATFAENATTTEEPTPKFKIGDRVLYDNTSTEIWNVDGNRYKVIGWEEWIDESKLKPSNMVKSPQLNTENMEEKELNLVELLKNCKGESFFSSVHGEVTFYEKSFSQEDKYHLFFEKQNGESFYTLWNGIFGRGIYPIIYPSKQLYEQYPLDAPKAWQIWAEERNKATWWRADWKDENGGMYWYVNKFLEADYDIDDNHQSNKEMHERGNYFRTEDEAKQASDLIRETLRQFHERKEETK